MTTTKHPNETNTVGQAGNALSAEKPNDSAFEAGGRVAAYASALQTIMGNGPDMPKAEAMRFFRSQLNELATGNPELLTQTFAAHAMLCEGLALTFAKKAAACPALKPDAAVGLLKSSLAAMASYGRCVAAVDAIRSKQVQALDPDDDEPQDADSDSGAGQGRLGRQRRGEG
jgi:hypothetical protein